MSDIIAILLIAGGALLIWLGWSGHWAAAGQALKQ